MNFSKTDISVHVPRIWIFDTTLRDGEQSALCTMYPDEKVEIARELENLGVDVIEAGFAASRQSDIETIKKICKVVSKPFVCSLSRCKKEDIDAAYESLKDYDKKMIHLFMPTSEIQVLEKMHKNYDQIEKMIADSINYARKFFSEIEFSCEDATRTDLNILKKIYGVAIDKGVAVINIPDTVGCIYPEEFGKIIKEIVKFAKEKNPLVRISVHCHDDLGLATINSIIGIENGAEQVECTINGIGERAGNCALEEIIAHEKHSKKFRTNIESKKIYQISKIISKITGVERKISPVTGLAAFSHKAGIHQHGISVSKKTYEILNAEDFGRKSELIIGPHSGIHGVITKAAEFGISIEKEKAEEILKIISERVRERKQKIFSDEDILNLSKNI